MTIFNPPVNKPTNVDITGIDSTTSATFQIDSDNSGPKLKNTSGKLQIETYDNQPGTVISDVIEFTSGYVRLKETTESGIHGVRVYGDRDDTIAPLHCAYLFTTGIYFGSNMSSPSIYDTFIYWPEDDDSIIEKSVLCFTPGSNEIRDSDFPTDTTLWGNSYSDHSISNITSDIIESGFGISNSRKISCTYTDESYGGSFGHEHTFPEESISWLQGTKSCYVRITNAETLTGLTISIDGEPYGQTQGIDVSSWSLNSWQYIERTGPISPYQGIPFSSVRFTINIPSGAPSGTYAFEIAQPISISPSIKEWCKVSDFATVDHTHTYVTGPESATAGNFPLLDVTGKILSDSTYAPDDFATAGHTHTEADITDLKSYVVYHGASADPPSTPAAGDEYYDTDDSKFYKYNGSSWVALN